MYTTKQVKHAMAPTLVIFRSLAPFICLQVLAVAILILFPGIAVY